MRLVNDHFVRLYLLKSALRDDRGQGFTEYAFVIVLIIAIAAAVGTVFSSALGSVFSSLANQI